MVCISMQTINNYQGDNRSCLVSNCLFRMGGAASIISNVYVCCTAHAAQAAPGFEERDTCVPPFVYTKACFD